MVTLQKLAASASLEHTGAFATITLKSRWPWLSNILSCSNYIQSPNSTGVNNISEILLLDADPRLSIKQIFWQYAAGS